MILENRYFGWLEEGLHHCGHFAVDERTVLIGRGLACTQCGLFTAAVGSPN